MQTQLDPPDIGADDFTVCVNVELFISGYR
jgi:hypothetical protein